MKFLIAMVLTFTAYTPMSLADSDRFNCSYSQGIHSQRDFNSRSESDRWCNSLGNQYCKSSQNSRYSWRGTFFRQQNFNHNGYDSWRDSRWQIARQRFDWIESNNYFGSNFRHRGGFGSCG